MSQSSDKRASKPVSNTLSPKDRVNPSSQPKIPDQLQTQPMYRTENRNVLSRAMRSSRSSPSRSSSQRPQTVDHNRRTHHSPNKSPEKSLSLSRQHKPQGSSLLKKSSTRKHQDQKNHHDHHDVSSSVSTSKSKKDNVEKTDEEAENAFLRWVRKWFILPSFLENSKKLTKTDDVPPSSKSLKRSQTF